MKISVLLENSAINDCYRHAHGLSVYVETNRHKILVDTGPDESIIFNAEKMGVDLKAVDTVVLSHGHYDHSGGIMPFAAINGKAPIYAHFKAGGDFYHGENYIGINKAILNLPQAVFLCGNTVIDDELSLFTDIKGRRNRPESNRELSLKTENGLVQDDFCHEQCVVIKEKSSVMISGCAHNGILNILDRYKSLYGSLPDVVISGFHMMKDSDYTEYEIRIITETAEELSKMPTRFYTGHCTGDKAFEIMSGIMKDNLYRISSGYEFEI